jgi:DNA-binding beta-propeller fold protein YncE
MIYVAIFFGHRQTQSGIAPYRSRGFRRRQRISQKAAMIYRAANPALPPGSRRPTTGERSMTRIALMAGVAAGLLAFPPASFKASADLAISANDGKGVLINGVNTVPEEPVPDNVMILDLASSPPKVVAETKVPTSLVGPPQSVAIAPDESFALVTAATKIDPTDKKKVVPHNIVSVIDLKATPPSVIATHETGLAASGVAINPSGTLALVANRNEGTLSIFTIAGKTLTPAGKVNLGDAKSGPSSVAFTPDGKMALVTRDGDNKISVLKVAGNTVELEKRAINAGLKPYPLGISPRGDFAAVGNVGLGEGDADTISLIDLTAVPPRVVDTVTVGQTPESLTVAPDGRHVVVTVMNGSNKASGSPFLNDHGLAPIFIVENMKFRKVTEAKVGHWCQGAAWNKDMTLLLVQCMVEQEIQLFKFDGKSLTPAGAIKVNGGPGGFGTTPVALK